MHKKHAYSLVILLSAYTLLFSCKLFANSAHNHTHKTPQSELAINASKGVFEDQEVKDRPLSDWDGVWQSIDPYLLNGDLDPVLADKVKKNKDKTIEEYREYYKKGYATDITMIGIENNVIEFHKGEQVDSCHYTYSGLKILHYASGKKGVRYLFECQDINSKAPKYIQFSDHIIQPQQSEHYHIYMGNESHAALLEEMDNWPTFYPYSLNKAQIVDEMLYH